MLRKIILILLLPAFSFIVHARPSETSVPVRETATLSLKESVLYAFNRDPSITQQAAQMGIAQAQVDQASSAWLPQVALTASGGHSQTTDSGGTLKNSAAWGLTLTQRLYDFGKTSNAISQQKALQNSSRFQLMSTLTSVAEKTALAFIEVKRYLALQEALQENIAALENVLHIANSRYKAGLSAWSDVLQAQSRLATLQATSHQYKAFLNSEKARLFVYTGTRARQFQALPELPQIQQINLNDINYAQIPSVMAAQASEAASRFAVDKAKAEHWPTLNLVGARTRYQSANSAYWDDEVQLNIQAPIYQGGAVSAQIRQAEGARAVALSQVEAARFEVLQKATVAQAEWQGAKEHLQAGIVQFENAQQSRLLYKQEYKLGKRTINDLLSVEQDVWQAAQAKVTAEYDAWNAAIVCVAAVDHLLPLVGIEKKPVIELPELN